MFPLSTKPLCIVLTKSTKVATGSLEGGRGFAKNMATIVADDGWKGLYGEELWFSCFLHKRFITRLVLPFAKSTLGLGWISLRYRNFHISKVLCQLGFFLGFPCVQLWNNGNTCCFYPAKHCRGNTSCEVVPVTASQVPGLWAVNFPKRSHLLFS